jgi:hypothetical protein
MDYSRIKIYKSIYAAYKQGKKNECFDADGEFRQDLFIACAYDVGYTICHNGGDLREVAEAHCLTLLGGFYFHYQIYCDFDPLNIKDLENILMECEDGLFKKDFEGYSKITLNGDKLKVIELFDDIIFIGTDKDIY